MKSLESVVFFVFRLLVTAILTPFCIGGGMVIYDAWTGAMTGRHTPAILAIPFTALMILLVGGLILCVIGMWLNESFEELTDNIGGIS